MQISHPPRVADLRLVPARPFGLPVSSAPRGSVHTPLRPDPLVRAPPPAPVHAARHTPPLNAIRSRNAGSLATRSRTEHARTGSTHATPKGSRASQRPRIRQRADASHATPRFVPTVRRLGRSTHQPARSYARLARTHGPPTPTRRLRHAHAPPDDAPGARRSRGLRTAAPDRSAGSRTPVPRRGRSRPRRPNATHPLRSNAAANARSGFFPTRPGGGVSGPTRVRPSPSLAGR